MANAPLKVTAAATKNIAAADAKAKSTGSLWYAFEGVGRAYLIKPGTDAASDADVSSVHGYSTVEQAVANPNSKGAVSQATITQWNLWASLPVGGGTEGVMDTINVTSSGGSITGASTPQNPTTAAADSASGLGSLDDLAQALGDKNTWIRAAKIIAGGVLLIIGLAHMTGADSAVSKAARSIPFIPV